MKWIIVEYTMLGGQYRLMPLRLFLKKQSIRRKGHCADVSVTSEDHDNGFKPTDGKVRV